MARLVLTTMALNDWNDYLDRLEDKDEKIFWPQGGFFPFAQQWKSSTFMRLRPTKWFKSITRKRMSQLTQMCTNHAPMGEYFKRNVWEYQDKPTSFFHCPCKHPLHGTPPVVQT